MADFVEILDSIMGSNKTNGIIRWMDENPEGRYMYISPLLSEVGEGSRLQTDLKYISFEAPEVSEGGTKADNLLAKLKTGTNICCTHALYLKMDKEHLQEIKDRGYTVIIDEELGIIESFSDYHSDDLSYLLRQGEISVSNTDGQITWLGKPVGGENKYHYLTVLCNSKALYATKRQDNVMVTHLPIELITCAKRVIIMTYMFDGNVLSSFLKVKGIPTKPFTEVVPTTISKKYIQSLITLIPPSQQIKDIKMSWSGYADNSRDKCQAISKYIRSVCRNNKARSVDVMYTFPKFLTQTTRSNGKAIRPASFVEYKTIKTDSNGTPVLNKQGEQTEVTEPCWLYADCRATNKYAFKWCLVHCYDKYPPTSVENYLQDYGCAMSRNVYATSTLLQWVWRSRIRNGEPIVLAIGSKRMYNLFKYWMEN